MRSPFTDLLDDSFHERAKAIPADDKRIVRQAFRLAIKAAHTYGGTPQTEDTALFAMQAIESLRNKHFPDADTEPKREMAEKCLAALSSSQYRLFSLNDLFSQLAKHSSPLPKRQSSLLARYGANSAGHRMLPPPAHQFLTDMRSQAYLSLCTALETVRDLRTVQQTGSDAVASGHISAKAEHQKNSLRRHQKQRRARSKKPTAALPYETTAINEWIRNHILATGRVIPCGTASSKAAKLSSAIRRKDPGTACFNASSLMEFIRQQCRLGVYDAALKARGISPYQAGIVRDYEKDWLNQRIIDEIRAKGKVPGQTSGPIPNADAGEDWGLVYVAFRQKGRGTASLGTDSLPGFIRQQCRLGVYDEVLRERNLSPYQAGIVRDYTKDWLNGRIIDQIRSEKKPPVPATGQIPKADAGENWQLVDTAFRQKHRGTETLGANCLHEFILQQARLGAYDAVLLEVLAPPQTSGKPKLKKTPNLPQPG